MFLCHNYNEGFKKAEASSGHSSNHYAVMVK